MKDVINHPSHYTQGNVECIDAIEAATSGLSGIEAVCTGNALKYLWRWKNKNGLEDLKKARWYIDRLLSLKEHEKQSELKASSIVQSYEGLDERPHKCIGCGKPIKDGLLCPACVEVD